MKRIVAISLVVLLLGGGALAWWLWPQSRRFYTDAETIREPAATAAPRDVLWQPPLALSDVINSSGEDYEPQLSADGLTLYFVRGKAGHNADIYTAQRTPDGWSDPEPLADVNSEYDDLGPAPSADGESLYFYSDRSGGSGGYDLWAAQRGSNGWQPAINLGPAVNSGFNDYGPALTPDGRTLYFASNRPRPDDIRQPNPDAWAATLREDLYRRDYDLYAAALTERGVAHAEPLIALNTDHNEGAPAVSPVGDFLYFASDRSGGAGGFDLYRARRLRDQLQPPTNLGAAVNTPANEMDPALALGGFGLYFSSDRVLAQTNTDTPRDYNVFQTSSREVFPETETLQRSIDWAAFWSRIWPSLLWALLSLLLLLLLLKLMREARYRRLSLLAKCLLASVFAHLLLLFLFNFWEVTASVAGLLKRRGGIQVALISTDTGDTIAGQIRGPVETTAALADAPPPDIERAAHEFEPQASPNMTALSVERSSLDSSEPLAVTMTAHDAPEIAPQPPKVGTLPTPLERAASPEFNLPNEAAAIHVDEPAPSDEHIPPQVSPPSRPALASVNADSSNRVIEANLPPEPQRASPAEANDRSLAERAVTVESVPPTQWPIRLIAITPTNPQPPALDLALPALASQRDHQQEAARGAAVAAVGDMMVPRAATTAAMPAISAPVAEIIPLAANIEPTEIGVAASLQKQISDSRPEYLVSSAKVDPLAPPQADFALPAVEMSTTTPASAQTEPSPQLAQMPLPSAAPARPMMPTGANAAPARMAELPPAHKQNVPASAESLLDPARTVKDAAAPTGSALNPTPQFSSAAHADPAALNLRLPSEVQAPINQYVQRAPQQRKPMLERLGGSDETERAVALALQWLSGHQSPDGHWDGRRFDARCGACGGQTDIEANAALTGLALLCFMGADHTHVKDGQYRENVARGVEWLLKRQKPDGDLRGDETMYSHGIATIALSEAYGMTGDAKLAEPVRRAVQFIANGRNTQTGGWRYDPGDPGDTSVTGWQVMAAKSAQMAGIDVPAELFDSARQWLERVSRRSRAGLYAYQPGRRLTPAMTAEGMFTQQLLGLKRDEPRMQASAEFLAENLPNWDARPNTYYWYYATLALFQHQGATWQRWNEALKAQLIAHQVTEGRVAGSWQPVGDWAQQGGRIYQTALCTLMLEVYYRYLPLYTLEPAEER